MPRAIDPRKTKKALRLVRSVIARAEAGEGLELSDWEDEFIYDIESRLEEFGNAFGDSEKGHLSEALSALQTQKLKEIDKKTRGIAPTFGGSFGKSGQSQWGKSSFSKGKSPREYDRDEEEIEELVPSISVQNAPPERPSGPPRLRLVEKVSAIESVAEPAEPASVSAPFLRVVKG